MEADLERLKLQEERELRFAERAHDSRSGERDKLNDAAVAGGDKALQALMYINGGAAIAMLGFVGASVGKVRFDLSDVAQLATGLAYFGCGVAFAVAAMGMGYFVNFARAESYGRETLTWDHPYCHAGDMSRRLRTFANWFQGFAFVCGVCSLFAFLLGAYGVRSFIEKMPKLPSTYNTPARGEVLRTTDL